MGGTLGSDMFQRMKWRGDVGDREGFLRYAANALSQLQRIASAAAGDISPTPYTEHPAHYTLRPSPKILISRP